MTPFVKVPRDAGIAILQRTALMAKPPEFFTRFFNGRIPTEEQRLFWIESAIQNMSYMHVYQNDTYIVEIADAPPFIHLDIRRLDGESCKEWRDIQQIKNELIGPEFEAVELFPAESRLVDTGNEYHLWVHSDPNFRFGLGFNNGRLVMREDFYPFGAPPQVRSTDSVGKSGVAAMAQ